MGSLLLELLAASRGERNSFEVMLYMVIERFKGGGAPEIYRRFREKGRMMPEGLEYISSWISDDLKTCWQVMQTVNRKKFEQWTRNWDDLMDFEIVEVRTSAEMRTMFDKI